MSEIDYRDLLMEDEEFFFNLVNLNVPGTTTVDPETTLIIFDVPSSGDTGNPGIPAPATLIISSAAPTPVNGFVDTEGNFTNGEFNFNIGTTEFSVGVPVPVGDINNDGADDSVVLNATPTAAIPAVPVTATLVLNPTPPPAPINGLVDLQGNFINTDFNFNIGTTEFIVGTPIPVGDRNNDGANDTVTINTLPTAAVAAVPVEATLLTFATVVDGFIDVAINENEVDTFVTFSFLDNQTEAGEFNIDIVTTELEGFEELEENVPINVGDQNNDSFEDFVIIFPQDEIGDDVFLLQTGTLLLSTPVVGELNVDGDFSSDNFNFNVGTTIIEENVPINVVDIEENGIPNVVIPNGIPTAAIPAQQGTATFIFGENDTLLVPGTLDIEGNFTNADSEISFNVGTTEIIGNTSIIVGDIDQNGIDDFVIPNGTPTAAIAAQPSPADLIFGTPEAVIIEGSLDAEGIFIGDGFSLDVGTTDFVEGATIPVGDLNGDGITETVTPNGIPTPPTPGIPDTVAPSTLISGPLPDR
ncbi:MAG: hypothetical protein F6K58_25745 [Symploca sp. SIO2E9]|nr:hypothetical protein [Symploca sp. SIO2E9]